MFSMAGKRLRVRLSVPAFSEVIRCSALETSSPHSYNLTFVYLLFSGFYITITRDVSHMQAAFSLRPAV